MKEWERNARRERLGLVNRGCTRGKGERVRWGGRGEGERGGEDIKERMERKYEWHILHKGDFDILKKTLSHADKKKSPRILSVLATLHTPKPEMCYTGSPYLHFIF